MSLLEKIKTDMASALKVSDKGRLETLRLVYSAIITQSKNDNKELTDDVVISILEKERKRRMDTSLLYINAENYAASEKEVAEAIIIKEYLPAVLSEEDTQKIVDELFIANPNYQIRDMGLIIKAVEATAKESNKMLDKGLLSRIIKLKF